MNERAVLRYVKKLDKTMENYFFLLDTPDTNPDHLFSARRRIRDTFWNLKRTVGIKDQSVSLPGDEVVGISVKV